MYKINTDFLLSKAFLMVESGDQQIILQNDPAVRSCGSCFTVCQVVRKMLLLQSRLFIETNYTNPVMLCPGLNFR